MTARVRAMLAHLVRSRKAEAHYQAAERYPYDRREGLYARPAHNLFSRGLYSLRNRRDEQSAFMDGALDFALDPIPGDDQ